MAYKRKRKVNLEQSMQVLTGGHEPKVTKANYRTDLIKALNWYNANREEKDYRAYAEYYVKHSPDLKEYAYAVSKADFIELRTIGVIGRLVRREQYVDIKDTMKALEQLMVLKDKYKKAPAVTKSKTVVAPVSVQDRIADVAKIHSAEIDGEIDQFVVDGKSEFSMRSYLLSKAISGAVAKKIGSFYDPLIKEIAEAIKGKDDQLKEGYSNFSKSQLKKYLEFIQAIVADCGQQVVRAKTLRKPRVRKAKPASVVAAKIKPMREFEELKLHSIDPAKIIGADEVWVYTPETRKLTWFRSIDGHLSVSGMSITNFDPIKSETKTLRKPEQFFKGLSSTGKRAMANAWKAVRAKASKPRARINDKMILFAVN